MLRKFNALNDRKLSLFGFWKVVTVHYSDFHDVGTERSRDHLTSLTFVKGFLTNFFQKKRIYNFIPALKIKWYEKLIQYLVVLHDILKSYKACLQLILRTYIKCEFST